MNSFIAIDFETANENRNSICQVAIAIVENNVVIDSKDWLIRPKELRFSPINVYKHGITLDHVKHSAEFPEIWQEIKPLINGNIVIAHNASFDMYVLRDVLQLYALELPQFNFWCTYLAAKQKLQLAKNTLPSVCLHYGINLSNHHNARYDAIACAEIAIKLGTPFKLRNFPIEIEPTKDFSNPFKIKKADLSGIEIYDLSENLSQQTFFGKNVVVTGTFNEISRSKAEEYVIRMGAKLASSINSKTSLLVMGENAGPSKIEKIKELNKTAFVPIIDEKEFLEVIEALGLN
ncbi:exonuclease domain-containing protein [Pedobacter sp. B4-66]|uniref:3'-5' exonuclease n=1 Tax=Pedobacter sp. B4-66 TaxID=2817280 RepID=UPI001BDB55F2|nr:exonuclease domain-containing protein [Pedobacter sp. B4-66]